MQTITFLWIVIAVSAALILAWYHYVFRQTFSPGLRTLLASLRFIALFALFLLLINPRFSRENYTVQPSNLVILADNSTSVGDSATAYALRALFHDFTRNESLKQRFRLFPFRFGSELEPSDSLNFKANTTNISKALKVLKETFGQTPTAVVLLTDGNQTIGEDYEYSSRALPLPVFPIAMGDTTRYEDIRIDRVNSNAYAFLNNQYPIEVHMTYEGNSQVSGRLQILVDGKLLKQESLTFSPESGSLTIQTLLKAQEVGLHRIHLVLTPLPNERNTANNERTIAIEVIDEKTRVGLVSDILHPDMGALVKAIENNERRSVEILKSNTPLANLEAMDVCILYQPDHSFRRVYDYLKSSGTSIFTITGPKTNWDFLNNIQNSFEKESTGQTEEILPALNPGFSLFDSNDISLEDFPPLEGELGDILIKKTSETLIEQRIRGVDIQEPLLALIQGSVQKEAVLFGENLWKWRMQSYRNQGDFSNFDGLIGKIILYLASSSAKERLTLDYPTVFDRSNQARIRASFFDANFAFNGRATLVLQIREKDSATNREIPMMLKDQYYEADLSDLPPGNYEFTANVKGENYKKSGQFTILDFDVEKQLIATDYHKLGRLAQKTGGHLFYPSEKSRVIDSLMADSRFTPIRKSKQNVVSLIDYRWLLAIIAAALAGEWFTRKYNGLI